MTLGGNHCRLLAGQRLPIALKKLAVFDPPKNFEKLLEFHYATEEPTFTTLGVASHCYIGMFQPWNKALTSVPIFTSCDQLAKALDTWAEVLDKIFAVKMFRAMSLSLSSELKSNEDRALKSLPINFVTYCVSKAIANLAMLATSTEAVPLSEADFLLLATKRLSLDVKAVAEECLYVRQSDVGLSHYVQRGSGNPAVEAKRPRPEEEAITVPAIKTTRKERQQEKKRKLLGAAATPVVAPTPPAIKGKTNLCYTWAAHAFNLAGATACAKTNCPNKHTPFVSGSVDKDAVKAELEGIQAPEFKRKLFAAVDAF